ncbi:hypothetical protein PR001_g25536 [Phytophthora rubi]|uniref:Uncharacterized protein n=1 Tax=Phytophthora rubi TaxID=129364 RepID=A0A6A3I743_9STRA|nr:hypothetical protein PR002_g25787 [Phytophthora rubi]KAE8976024.1 hypothetical protein PR001_g25536 [Phytophthora rubi]
MYTQQPALILDLLVLLMVFSWFFHKPLKQKTDCCQHCVDSDTPQDVRHLRL